MGLLIEISATETDELIINRGFCRRPALQDYCEKSQDSQLHEFANLLYMGITITRGNILDFLEKTAYVINFLSSIAKADRHSYFPFYREDLYEYFLEDLTDGLHFLKTVQQEKNLDKLEVDIM